MLNVEKKYVEVRSSTVLSQVELCFICPQFSVFFFVKLRHLLFCLCTIRQLTLLLFWYIFSLFVFC
jgi:hypothetical protein